MLKKYIVTSATYAHRRTLPSSAHGDVVGSVQPGDIVEAIDKLAAINTDGGQNTTYLCIRPLGLSTFSWVIADALAEYVDRAADLVAIAQKRGSDLVKNRKKYGDEKCGTFVSKCLWDAGLLTRGKYVCHTAAGAGTGKKSVTGTEHLKNCSVRCPNRAWDKCGLLPGDVCVWDSNIAIYAGNGKWYDAGGPFVGVNVGKSNVFTTFPSSPNYDRKHNVLCVIRPK